MNGRVTAVWSVALGLSAVLGGLALRHPAAPKPPPLSSGPLFAVPTHAAEPVDAAAVPAAVVPVSVALTGTGCTVTPGTIPAGPATFTIINPTPGQTVVSEAELTTADGSRILAEAEDVDPGTRGLFSLRLSAGSYAMNCPGPGLKPIAFTVTPAHA